MSMGLTKSAGPDCPKCGCNATAIVEAGQSPAPWAKFACDFCNHRFSVGRQPPPGPVVNGVVYKTTRCECPNPGCRAKNPPVKSTIGIYRWHKCDKCGQTFKSVEG